MILERLISDEDMHQTNLFSQNEKLEVSKQTKVTDEINKKFGGNTIKFG